MTNQSVFVAVYSHKYGEDIRVFTTERAAQSWKNEIGEEWFSVEFPHDPRPTESIGEAYFDLQLNCGMSEWFSITETQIEQAEAA